MTGYVIDASALVEVVLHTELGEAVANMIRDRRLIAPELIDVEVLATLRRSVLAKSVSDPEASLAVHRLINAPITRHSHRTLVQEAWRYRQNVSAYDSFYVALAHKNRMPLITVDARLSRAPVTDIAIINLR
ncbi:MAG: type II toxin-antitoxin system VapC family toxin [Chloroflexi bacterium]|nr:type II toxin-antitoxin system VapC family toxin [Chloroflexota bacterium]